MHSQTSLKAGKGGPKQTVEKRIGTIAGADREQGDVLVIKTDEPRYLEVLQAMKNDAKLIDLESDVAFKWLAVEALSEGFFTVDVIVIVKILYEITEEFATVL